MEIINFNFKSIFGMDLEDVDDILENKDKYIRRFTIPKNDGTERNITAPIGKLKYLQKAIYYNILKKYKHHDAAHGFARNRGISTNAIPHIGAASLGKIDIKKFFDSISTDHLKNCLFGNKNVCRYCKNYERMMHGKCNPSIYKNKMKKFDFGCEEIKAVFIPDYCKQTGYQSLFLRVIEACIYKGCTAQGFPTSPMIANIVLRGLDKAVTEHCDKESVTYTRYADDLTFSSKTMNSKQLSDYTKLKTYRLLWAFKFFPKREKTRYRNGKSTRLKTCGVVVNVKSNLEKSLVHKFRAKVHNAICKTPELTNKKKIRQLKGWASYLMSINKDKGMKYMTMLTKFEHEKFPKVAT